MRSNRHVRLRLILALVAVASLVLAAAVLAAAPKKGATFKGGYSPAYKVGKYTARIKFHVASDGSAVDTSRFDSPFCGGVGGPPPTHNPFTHVKFKPMAIAGGKFSGTKQRQVGGNFPHTEKYKVKGKFTKAKRAKGTFTVTDHFKQAGTPDCSEAFKWKASAK